MYGRLQLPQRNGNNVFSSERLFWSQINAVARSGPYPKKLLTPLIYITILVNRSYDYGRQEISTRNLGRNMELRPTGQIYLIPTRMFLRQSDRSQELVIEEVKPFR